MDHPIGGLYLPSKVFCALTEHSGEGYYGPKTEAILSSLVLHWIATAKASPRPWLGESDADDSEPAAAPLDADAPVLTSNTSEPSASRGYQWKQVFLPNGTELRVIHGGRSTYAKVEAEQIISDGIQTTPSRLANASGCGTCNAWQAIRLRFPGSTRWQRAAGCRR
ncbi:MULTISPECIES: hypothetical protein [unclassified Duganella]|jgi:hypothetical protein|uniref:hypothetical protein n=1 Tax=unclassified Duganella TaxID=2636909 RepID=UPI00087E7EC5|nr:MULTISPECIES: hypothetical protein [unclassified Duganella]SDF98902.1 hypothetical protein SAMN05216320_102277 [Duganella sp. OV458]SDJ05964.1 hypothetical protein SAMN05428973_102274 [Duganella sp. OV510]